jgi:nucleoside 2-deoxyribosyltransferase
MAGRGKRCFAYSNDPAVYAERVARSFAVTKADAGHLIDDDGLTVEDFGLPDNLMMIHTLDLHGARLVTPRQRPADIWHDLTSFEACVALAADRAEYKSDRRKSD